MIRWVRQGKILGMGQHPQERSYLFGLLVVRTYPKPHRQYAQVVRLPGMRAIEGLPAIPPRIVLLYPA